MASLFRPISISTKFTRAFSSSRARLDCKFSFFFSFPLVNKVQLIGRVGADPSVTEFGEDRRVVNYTVATSETRPDKEGNLIKRTQWHRITSWNSADWLPEKVKKGDLVYVEGSLRYNDFTDREGVQRTKAEIHQSKN
ncbi:hypothetical protein INT45_011485 [Circinella minor]|uniref:Single-stranded DNA-binding protein n=1 Tax=Circinella minor TaxID=1195481 RepID=A0A8H7S0G1_9FUNG|nr:hypothetical protein INT45_011485 [Circinella minor]